MKKILFALIFIPLLAGCVTGKIDYKSEGEIISKNLTHNIMCLGVKGYDSKAGEVAKKHTDAIKSKAGFDMEELHFWVEFYNGLELARLKNSGLEEFCMKKS